MAGCTGNGTGGTTSSAPSDVPSTAPTSQVASTTAGFQHEIAVEPDEELRAELLAMMAEDQAVRTGIAPPGDSRTSDELFAAWDSVDAANAARMREVLEEYGRPGWSLVGEDGAEAAWVLVQHADLQLDLQKRGLAMLEAAVAAGDASLGDLAYHTDRVLVAEGQPQIYGTQVSIEPDGTITPRTPIVDEADVDARRAEAGLSNLEEYYEELREMFGDNP